MNVTFSPCPNDTFIFHAWVHGKIAGAPSINVSYADIGVTNHLVSLHDGPDLVKISCAALPWAADNYGLLPCGGAIGLGCGPLLITADGTTDPNFLRGGRVGVPSDRSTACLLYKLWAVEHLLQEETEIVEMPFHNIMNALKKGDLAAGVVIHEARFTYATYGLTLLVDLGQWWETSTQHMIPLGVLVAKRNQTIPDLATWVKRSIQYANSHPYESLDYIRKHAQEMDNCVIQQHVNLYVNEYSLNLRKEGYAAISTLLGRAIYHELVPSFDLNNLFDM